MTTHSQPEEQTKAVHPSRVERIEQAAQAMKPTSLLEKLGPGLVTGAADDDPSGIATYSQAGAQIGAPILWSMLLTWPLMSGIQYVSTFIARVTGKGLAANMRAFHGRPLTTVMVLLLIIANLFNIGADVAAMGAAARLVIGSGEANLYALLLAAATIALIVYVPYTKYQKVLKWLTLVLFSYVAVLFFIEIPWKDVAIGTFLPTFSFAPSFVTTFIALLGTTISPYLFFWQASQEVEEIETSSTLHPLLDKPSEAPVAIKDIKEDTVIGMAISNIIASVIILATTATLHAHGVLQIDSADQAAQALRPIAGDLCFVLFALGIIGTGALAIPVLAGSAAFAVAEVFGFHASLEDKPTQDKRFYGTLTVAAILGVAMIYVGLDPIKALYYSAVLNGLISAPVMVVIMLMAANRKIMGDYIVSGWWSYLGWAATILMAAASIIFFATL